MIRMQLLQPWLTWHHLVLAQKSELLILKWNGSTLKMYFSPEKWQIFRMKWAIDTKVERASVNEKVKLKNVVFDVIADAWAPSRSTMASTILNENISILVIIPNGCTRPLVVLRHADVIWVSSCVYSRCFRSRQNINLCAPFFDGLLPISFSCGARNYSAFVIL